MKQPIHRIRYLPLVFALCMNVVGARLSAQEAARGGYDEVVAGIKRLHSRDASTAAISSQTGGKCGLGPLLEAKGRWDSFTAAQQREISELLAPPVTQKSRRIGHFTICYDTTGVHTPALLDINHNPIPNTAEQFVDSAGESFNRSWAVEVDSLGFNAPPFFPQESAYTVYIQEEYGGLYGLTMPVHQLNQSYPPLYDSYIEIDNDYLGLYSEGIAGLRVTAAHEFHHAIQLGGYGYWSTDRYFLEMTSTWMEDVVYDDVNDYFQYLTNAVDQTSQFSYPYTSFTKVDNSIEYSRAVWCKFIEERFSREVMHATWNHIRQMNALAALDQALRDAGSSFRQAFLEWALWNMNTGPNADTTAHYYREARSYPTMRMNPPTTFTSGQRVISGSTDVMSSQYYPFSISQGSGEMRFNAIITNVNMTPTSQAQAFSYVCSDKGDDTYRHLSNGLYVKLSVPDPANWASQETVPAVVTDIIVYPNPFVADGSSKLSFHLPAVSSTDATLTIMSNSLDRVITKQLSVVELKPLEPSLQWDGYDEEGRISSTGIYFYFITVGDLQFTGKFAIIRE